MHADGRGPNDQCLLSPDPSKGLGSRRSVD